MEVGICEMTTTNDVKEKSSELCMIILCTSTSQDKTEALRHVQNECLRPLIGGIVECVRHYQCFKFNASADLFQQMPSVS